MNASLQSFPPRLIHANSLRRRQKKPDKVYANFKILANGNDLTSIGEGSDHLASTLVAQSVNITKTTFGGGATHMDLNAVTIDKGLTHLNQLEQMT